jgi:hypothetical protein
MRDQSHPVNHRGRHPAKAIADAVYCGIGPSAETRIPLSLEWIAMTSETPRPAGKPDNPPGALHDCVDEALRSLLALTAEAAETHAVRTLAVAATAARSPLCNPPGSRRHWGMDAIGHLLAARLDSARMSMIDARSALVRRSG